MPDTKTPDSILEQLEEYSSDQVMNVIYDNVNALLGAGNQLFAMEFPARPLNGKAYTYAADDCYSTLTKPYPVQEAEFLLSDQLYDVSPIVQGPNGERLSTAFTTVLNNYVPKLKALKSFVSDQKGLRKWLLTHVEDEVDGKTRDLSRMAISKELYGQFLQKRNEWYRLKNRTYDEYKLNDDLDGYARWLSSEGLVQEEKLNNFFNDAVVRGNYHEVLTLLGFLNVSSPAEVLETTKQKMRASLRRSLDGSTDIYPVQFQPSDWFKSLQPNLNPKDLTMATESLMVDYQNKQARMRGLKAQLAELTIVEIPKEQQQTLLDQIANAEKDLRALQTKMMRDYGQSMLTAVKTVIDIFKDKANPVKEAKDTIETITKKAVGTLTSAQKRILSLVDGIPENLIKSIADSYQQEGELIASINKLNDVRMAYAEAKVKDMRLHRQRLEEQIGMVQADLDFLTPLVSGVLRAEQEKEEKGPGEEDKKEQKESLLSDSASDTVDSSFMDVIIKSDENGTFSASSTSASSKTSSFGAGGWFWSGRRESKEVSAEEQQKRLAINKKLEIGFRVKKVAIDRGGWFNPTIFKLSGNYYRLADIRCGKGINKEDVFNAISGVNSAERLEGLVTYTSEDGKKTDYVLPAFPTGFVIAKDITIRIAATKEEAESSQKYLEQSKSSSGGFFCFRGSSGNASKSNSESTYYGSTSNYFYIRIPGPQILGWFLEFTGSDNATPYEALETEMYGEAALAALLEEDAPEGKDGQRLGKENG